jgi:RNA polymerase sigma-70 factor (ECF subfamily)
MHSGAPPTLAQRLSPAKIATRTFPIRLTRADLGTARQRTAPSLVSTGIPGIVRQRRQARPVEEAITLGRLLVELLPEPEAEGLLALMLLHDARRVARVSPDGELVLLDDQERTLWNRTQIDEGRCLVEKSLRSRRVGPYALQAAIAAVHAEALTASDTDWPQIVGLYDVLMRVEPTPVVELNRAVAIAMRDGPDAGLARIDAILARGDLLDYHLAHSARADLLRRLGRTHEAISAYERAIALNTQEPERRFLARRLADLRTA